MLLLMTGSKSSGHAMCSHRIQDLNARNENNLQTYKKELHATAQGPGTWAHGPSVLRVGYSTLSALNVNAIADGAPENPRSVRVTRAGFEFRLSSAYIWPSNV